MKVHIESIKSSASIGIFDWEKEVRQNLIIDVTLDAMNDKSIFSDELDDTINYKELSRRVIQHSQSCHFGLIERLAFECCQIILNYNSQITQVEVIVHKPGALNIADNVSVTATLSRNQVVIGIGSNIEPQHYIAKAQECLQKEFNVTAIAKKLTTQAIGRKDSPDFINTAVIAQTQLNKEHLTRRLKHIEWELGRKYNKDLYSSRVIDLDILLWNQQIEDADIFSRDFLQTLIEQLLPGVLDTLKRKNTL